MDHLFVPAYAKYNFLFYWSFYLFTCRLLCPFFIPCLETLYPSPPPQLLWWCPPPIHLLPSHAPRILLCWDNEPSEYQGTPLLLMPYKAIPFYIWSWSHLYFHVYTLVGDFSPSELCMVLLFDIVVPPTQLQSPSASSVLPLTSSCSPPAQSNGWLGSASLWSSLWMALPSASFPFFPLFFLNTGAILGYYIWGGYDVQFETEI